MGKIKLYPSGKLIPIDNGQTVLSALEKNGHALPNNCRAGACGECKVKVRSGEYDQGFILDMALSQDERAQGLGLMCMAKLKSEVLEIEWGGSDARPKLFPPKENSPYIVLEKWQVTSSIVRLKLRSLGTPMRFWPGQYISIGNPKRSYSIANNPNDEGDIILFITKIKGGKVSQWAHDQLKVGEQISVSGPYGTFVGDPSAHTPVLCLASGSGLAPIMSLAQAALFRGGHKEAATILFSARTRADVLEEGLFSYLQAKFPNFKFNYTLTQEKNPHGLEGRIPQILPGLYPDLKKYSVYIAGNPDFVEACSKSVAALGCPETRIHSEKFTPQ